MEQFEKVVKGLECCLPETQEMAVLSCADCPYDPCSVSVSLPISLIDDVRKLITAQRERIRELEAGQTARVMSLEEVETAEDCMEPVFVEMLDENGKPGETPDVFSWRFVKHIKPLTDGKIYVLNNVGFSSALYVETYNITWRCWTQRPTDEQREAVKWE